jgi:hypothetical protein
MQPLMLVSLKWINRLTTWCQSKIQRKLLILVTSSNNRVTATFVKSASRHFSPLLVFLINWRPCCLYEDLWWQPCKLAERQMLHILERNIDYIT